MDDDQFAIGVGDRTTSAFSELHDGDALPLITDIPDCPHASGYHAFLQMSVAVVEAGSANLTTKLVEPNAGLVLHEQTNSIALMPLEEGGQALGLATGLQVNLCPSTTAGYAMHGTEMRLNLELDAGSALFESSVMITPQCPAGDDRCTDNGDTMCQSSAPPGCAAP